MTVSVSDMNFDFFFRTNLDFSFWKEEMLSGCPFFKGLFEGWTQTVSSEYRRTFDG